MVFYIDMRDGHVTLSQPEGTAVAGHLDVAEGLSIRVLLAQAQALLDFISPTNPVSVKVTVGGS